VFLAKLSGVNSIKEEAQVEPWFFAINEASLPINQLVGGVDLKANAGSYLYKP
jgi:hypothetical protein